MRTPQDIPPTPRATAPRLGRGRWWIVAGVVVLIVILASLKSLAAVYTDSLWFTSVTLHRVWSTLLAVKVGLFASFGAVFFVAVWVNLAICDRMAARRGASTDPEDELVRRYQRTVRPYTGRVRAAVAFVLALIAASGAVGQWNNWILFTHSQSFGEKDPQFGKDVGFFVFRLPFLQFLVDWTLVALVVVVVVTTVFHYLNGGIRAQRSAPRVRPMVKVHLSVLLALIALVKAAGYILQRYQLDMSTNGYVEGAGYADVHARLPALEVLFFISLFAAAILLYNVRRQGWTLPVLAIGLWAFVALVIGVIYPAVLQAFKVNPAQSKLETPYIKRNIAATRAAYGLQHVKVATFTGSTTLSPSVAEAHRTTLENIRLWDPNASITQRTFQKKQNIKSYYDFQSVGVDRYTVGGTLRPAVVGVRQINPTDLPASGWVNTHLQYTHGEGVVVAQANKIGSNGNPTFAISDVPPVSTPSFPKVAQPGVYFGLNQPGYVVAATRQLELDYPKKTGTDAETHYQGAGGVPMGSWLTKAAFAVRLGDFNLLISDLITPQSKMMFVRDVVTRAQTAAPFLTFDSDPYAAVVTGHIDWILDGYTTTANYPYSQNANTQQVPAGSGLPGSYNYVRNSVKVVIDAYSGKMTFYAMGHDPILHAYEAAFPGMFTPAAHMSPKLRAHLRYPENIFSVQAATYGRYHITSPSNFYTAGNAWTLSPTIGVGSPQNNLQVTITTNAQGQVTSGSYEPMAPVYQVLAPPGQRQQAFTISDAYVPAGQSSQILSAFIMGNANPSDYGQLTVYETPSSSSVNGPVLADAAIQQTTTVSKDITLLNKDGSQVLLGNILPVPIDQSMLYVRPLYVVSSGNPQPQLKDVIVVFGQHVAMKSTLNAAINTLLGTSLTTTSGSSAKTGTLPSGTTSKITSPVLAEARADLQQAAQDFTKAQKDLTTGGDLAAYQADMNNAVQLTQKARQLLGQTASGGSASAGTKSTGTGSARNGAAAPTPTSGTTSTTGARAGTASSTTFTGGSPDASGSATARSTGSDAATAGSSTRGGSTGSGSSSSVGGRSRSQGAQGTGSLGASTTTTAPGEA
ncbi:MAG: UPF0182 family protein [Acidimicrobiales bacterium]